ncbi:MAG: hypothetical protein ACAI35_03935 [Candidatus Methylacidiphilales bacterium]
MSDPFISQLKELGCTAESKVSLATAAGETISDSETALQWFEQLCGMKATGWAQFSGANVWVDSGSPKSKPEGILLAAEFHIADPDESYRLRHDGKGWIAVKIVRKDNVDNAFLERRGLLRADTKPPTLLEYEVAWEADKDEPFRPIASRFIGTRVVRL